MENNEQLEIRTKAYDEMLGQEFYSEFKTLDDYIEFFTWNAPSATDPEYKYVCNMFKMHQMFIDPYGRFNGDKYIPKNELDEEQLAICSIKDIKKWAKDLWKENNTTKQDKEGFSVFLKQMGIKNTRKMNNSKAVTIDGITYNSVTEAAEKLGIKRTTLAKRIKEGRI